jgi:hypothetical protein
MSCCGGIDIKNGKIVQVSQAVSSSSVVSVIAVGMRDSRSCPGEIGMIGTAVA